MRTWLTTMASEVEIRQPVALRTIHGVEMAALGRWHASTGWTTFTDDDFVNAVAALECPGVRNPVLKLGHTEEDAASGVRWDGEPAVGWVANMRFDGAKLIGDFTGMPSWLADADENGVSVLAAGYPDRSIEINRPFLCQIGHLHPSVVTAVAFLGIYAPGVGVLKSMQDVYAAFTEQPEAAQQTLSRAHLSTTVRLSAAAEPRALTDIEQRSGVDFDQLREVWDGQLDDLLAEWETLDETQRADLAAQIEQAVDAQDADALGALVLTGAAGAAILTPAMVVMAQASADDMVDAARRQGVQLAGITVAEDDVATNAASVTSAMAASTASTAGRNAAQLLGTGDGEHVASQVVGGLEGLSDRFLRDQLGGALSTARQIGRNLALQDFGGQVDWYASEVDDASACSACAAVDGTKFDDEEAALAAYGSGRYAGCLSGPRCRGQLIAVLDEKASASASPQALSTTVRMTLGGAMPSPPGGAVKASVSVEDISRKYYESAGYSMWITEMQVDPLQLIAADDATGKYYRIPVELSGEQFTFGEPQEVAVQYADVAAASVAPVKWRDRKLALAAAGKKEDGSDLVAKDVSPVGAAIRKVAEKTAANATVLETEVTTPEVDDETPDADPAPGPTTTPKEALSVDKAKIREALGLAPEASDTEVAEAFAAQAAAAVPPAPTGPDTSALLSALPKDGGAMLIDPENYKTLVTMAAQGQHAFEQMQRNERDTVLRKAMDDGRFPVSRLAAYSAMWDRDPVATKAYIELMPKQSVPTMAAGYLGAEVSQNETDMAYDAYMGNAGKVGA